MKILRTFEMRDGTFALRQKNDGAYELVTAHGILLSSAALGTERAFGALASRIAHSEAHVVVGGLGFGHTALGVLESHATARVTVVERLEVVVDLCRSELTELSEGVLERPRVTLVQGDVYEAIGSMRDLDAILLDVDNGPEWATFRDNARLYAHEGLERARAALRPGGFLAVWSGYERPKFVASLRAAGFEVDIAPLHERGIVRARAYVGTRR
jgi:spermidine synthase